MLRFSKNQVRILGYLYQKSEAGEERPYLTEIASDLGTAKAVISDNMKKLEEKALVETEKKGPLKFYRLSGKGKALTWALLNPEALKNLYQEHILGV